MIENATATQKKILASPAKSILITGCTKTGKTTVLAEFASMRSGTSFLYVAASTGARAAAESLMPGNVTCRTANQLALHAIGTRFNGKIGQTKPNELAKLMSVAPAAARGALELVSRYLESPHVEMEQLALSAEEQAAALLPLATQIWEKMKDPLVIQAKLSTQGIAKLYQLTQQSAPTLANTFQHIMVDETQDLPAPLLRALEHQQIPIIYAIDRNQRIQPPYSACEPESTEETYELDESFGYGAHSAELASEILKFAGAPVAICPATTAPAQKSVLDNNLPVTLVSLNTGSAIDAAINIITNNTPVHLVGGAKSLQIQKAQDCYSLYIGKKEDIKDPFFRQFENYQKLREYIIQSGDKETKSFAKLVVRYKEALPAHLIALSANAVERDQAFYSIATAAATKGESFRQVLLAADFLQLLDLETTPYAIAPSISVEEARLLYIAAASATEALVVPEEMAQWLATGLKAASPVAAPATEEGSAVVSVAAPSAEPEVARPAAPQEQVKANESDSAPAGEAVESLATPAPQAPADEDQAPDPFVLQFLSIPFLLALAGRKEEAVANTANYLHSAVAEENRKQVSEAAVAKNIRRTLNILEREGVEAVVAAIKGAKLALRPPPSPPAPPLDKVIKIWNLKTTVPDISNEMIAKLLGLEEDAVKQGIALLKARQAL